MLPALTSRRPRRARLNAPAELASAERRFANQKNPHNIAATGGLAPPAHYLGRSVHHLENIAPPGRAGGWRGSELVFVFWFPNFAPAGKPPGGGQNMHHRRPTSIESKRQLSGLARGLAADFRARRIIVPLFPAKAAVYGGLRGGNTA